MAGNTLSKRHFSHLGSGNPNWKGGNIDRTCEQCGKVFQVKPCRRKARFCSLPCANAWQLEHPYPQQLFLGLVMRMSTKYPSFWFRVREKILRRDGGRCRSPLCRSSDTLAHVHHIDFDKDNCADENLITVCPSCNQRANRDRLLWSAILGAHNQWRCLTGNFDLDKRGLIEIN